MFELSVQDLFVAGLATDLVGASLLAKSLFKSPLQIAERADEHNHFDAVAAVQLAEDKVDGNFGLAYLSTGFFMQAIGYEITLTSTTAGSERGIEVAVTALLIALCCALPAIVAWRLLRLRLVCRQLVKIEQHIRTRGGDHADEIVAAVVAARRTVEVHGTRR